MSYFYFKKLEIDYDIGKIHLTCNITEEDLKKVFTSKEDLSNLICDIADDYEKMLMDLFCEKFVKFGGENVGTIDKSTVRREIPEHD